jgi:rSAM/selenodomain-associated transferase 2
LRWRTVALRAPLVSFVIPVLNEQAGIAGLLEELGARFEDSERLVVDGGSVDQSVSVATPLSTRVLNSPAGRARQMNLGAASARGQYLLFLHADSRPSISSLELSGVLAANPPWGFFKIRLDGGHWMFRVIERAMNLRSRLTGVATGDQMLFVRRDVFLSNGGFADIPLMEDVEFCKRLRRESSPQVVSQPVLTSARRWEDRGTIRTVINMWLLRLAFFLGASPQRLWRHYYGP